MDVIINSNRGQVSEKTLALKTQGNAYLNLLTSLGYDELNPPLASLLTKIHGLKGEWLVVSPIHWEASHNNAVIQGVGSELGLDEEQSKHWFNLFAKFLAEDSLELHYHDAHTWLLRVDNKPTLNARPVHQIINYPLMPELAQLDASMYWQKFFTESQMFFASQPNQTLLNGVWLWGGGPLLAQDVAICSDEVFLKSVEYCSSKTFLYNPKLRLKDFAIILLNTPNSLSEQHKKELQQSSTRWFWNDIAYSKTANWFTRFWRTLIHAH